MSAYRPHPEESTSYASLLLGYASIAPARYPPHDGLQPVVVDGVHFSATQTATNSYPGGRFGSAHGEGGSAAVDCLRAS